MSEQYEPPYRCRQLSIPIAVVEMVGTPIPRKTPSRKGVAETFSHTHVMLLGYIDMMVDWKGEGCWATNEYLAKKIHRTADRVKQLIQDCKALGLLIDKGTRVVKWNGKDLLRRILETSWSRNSSNQGEGNRLPSSQGNRLPSYRRTKKTVRSLNPKPDLEKADFAPRTSAPPKTRTHDDNKCEQASSKTRKGAAVEDDNVLVERSASDLDKIPKHPIEDKHRQFAKRVRDFAKRQGFVRSAQKRMWAQAVGVMERDLAKQGFSFDQVVDLWTWHETNWKKNGYNWPEIANVKQFHQRFGDILKRRRYFDERKPVARSELTREANDAIVELDSLSWPNGSESSLPAAVQRSVDALRAFVADLAKADVSRFDRDAWFEVLNATGLDSPDYVVKWFKRVCRFVREQPGFGGDLLRHAWHPKHNWFVTEVKSALSRYCGDDTRADALLAAVIDQPVR